MKKYKVLNLYCGIGGNRKLWTDCEVTAIELNPEIAKIYQDFFPDDKVIVTDAHQYLLDHFKEFDFIWSSPPCQSHTKLNTVLEKINIIRYPDMKLYQEIIFLNQFFKGKWIIENVIPYYNPLIKPQKNGRHLFWSNINLKYINVKNKKAPHEDSQIPYLQRFLGFDLDKYKISNKRQLLRNCVLPETGKYIFDRARNIQIEENAPQLKINFK